MLKTLSNYKDGQRDALRVKIVNCESHKDNLAEPLALGFQAPNG